MSTYERVPFNGRGIVSTTISDRVFPALGGFDIQFTHKDSHVNQMVVGGGDATNYQMGLDDGDGNAGLGGGSDPISGWSKFIDLGNRPIEEVTGESFGKPNAFATVRPLSPTRHFVLRGFEIRAKASTNHHIRALGVQFQRATNQVEVTFSDDSPGDDEFTFRVLFTIVDDALATGKDVFPHFLGTYSQGFPVTKVATVRKSFRGVSLLSSFYFGFLDDDHHFRRMTIDPVSREDFRIRFTDDEEDNLVQGFIQYVNVVQEPDACSLL